MHRREKSADAILNNLNIKDMSKSCKECGCTCLYCNGFSGDSSLDMHQQIGELESQLRKSNNRLSQIEHELMESKMAAEGEVLKLRDELIKLRDRYDSLRLFSKKTHYAVLNVNQTASKKEVRDAYIKLSKQYHPDLNKNNSSSHQQFIDIKKAYDVLSDPLKRSQYDRAIISGFHRDKSMKNNTDYTEVYQNAQYSDPYQNIHRHTAEERAYWERYHSNEHRKSILEIAVCLCLLYWMFWGHYYFVKFFLTMEKRKYKSDIDRIMKTDSRYWTALDREMVDENENKRSPQI